MPPCIKISSVTSNSCSPPCRTCSAPLISCKQPACWKSLATSHHHQLPWSTWEEQQRKTTHDAALSKDRSRTRDWRSFQYKNKCNTTSATLLTRQGHGFHHTNKSQAPLATYPTPPHHNLPPYVASESPSIKGGMAAGSRAIWEGTLLGMGTTGGSSSTSLRTLLPGASLVPLLRRGS